MVCPQMIRVIRKPMNYGIYFSMTEILEIPHQLQLLRVPVSFINGNYKLDHALLFLLDDDATMSYLNGWDKQIPNLDVVDDYKSEKEQILAVQGKSFPFSFGDVSDTIHYELSFILFMFDMLLKFFLCLVCC